MAYLNGREQSSTGAERSHGENRGSSPLGSANYFNDLADHPSFYRRLPSLTLTQRSRSANPKRLKPSCAPHLPLPAPATGGLLLLEKWRELHLKRFGQVPQRHDGRVALA
jgi:hypothetical protein